VGRRPRFRVCQLVPRAPGRLEYLLLRGVRVLLRVADADLPRLAVTRHVADHLHWSEPILIIVAHACSAIVSVLVMPRSIFA